MLQIHYGGKSAVRLNVLNERNASQLSGETEDYKFVRALAMLFN